MQYPRTNRSARPQRSGTRKARRSLSQWFWLLFASDRARFIALTVFVLVVALAGGSSRPDVLSLPFLRPIAVLFSTYAVSLASSKQLRDVRMPLSIICALMLLALLQLVPVPAAIWLALPNRETLAQASALVGMADRARPFSLDPGRTWNAFFSLFVPLAAVTMIAIQAPERRRSVIRLLMAIGMLGVVFGLLQMFGGAHFQLYRIAHDSFPTGLFANKNHQAVLLLWLMLAASWLANDAGSMRNSAVPLAGAAILILSLLPLLVLTGSRTGLLLCIPVLALCGWLLLRTPVTVRILRSASRRVRLLLGAAIVIALAQVLFVFVTLYVSGRHSALSRLFTLDPGEDLRWAYLPEIRRMVFDYAPFGSGFGSFEKVFNAYEPAAMLTSRYMNQAHDDLLQLVIEAGVPGALILFAGLAWIGIRLVRSWRSSRRGGRGFTLFIGASIALWLAASLADYPLRTPLGAMLFASLTVLLALPSVGGHSEASGRDPAA
jgi:O-antigen ligase